MPNNETVLKQLYEIQKTIDDLTKYSNSNQAKPEELDQIPRLIEGLENKKEQLLLLCQGQDLEFLMKEINHIKETLETALEEEKKELLSKRERYEQILNEQIQKEINKKGDDLVIDITAATKASVNSIETRDADFEDIAIDEYQEIDEEPEEEVKKIIGSDTRLFNIENVLREIANFIEQIRQKLEPTSIKKGK